MFVGSKIHGIVTNITGGGIWDQSKSWDVIFSDSGLLFAKLHDASWEAFLPFGMSGLTLARRLTSDAYQEKREALNNLPLDKILEQDKKNWFVSYNDITQIRIRSSPIICGFDIKMKDGKVRGYNFSKDQYEKLVNLVTEFLADKYKKGFF